MEHIVALILFAAGLVSLFLGRKLFWIYIGIVGFLLGAVIGGFAARDNGMVTQLALALVFGIARHILGLVNAQDGARRWRQMLSDSRLLAPNDPALIGQAWQTVVQASQRRAA